MMKGQTIIIKPIITKGFERVDKCSSGVVLRYYAFKEYKKLLEYQREELRLWRSKRSNKNTDQGYGGG